MRKIFFTLIFSLLSVCSFAQDSLQVMFYNLFRFPTSPPANRAFMLRDIVDSVQPDLFMACEIVNSNGAADILKYSFSNQNDSFAKSDFHYSLSAQGDPLQQMVYYNTRKLILIQQAVIPTTIRDINHYTFILNTQQLPLDSVFVEVFVTHLKSSNGTENKLLRLGMVDSFVTILAQLPTDRHVLFSGDFNFYDANEPAYQKIIDTLNPIKMVDPIAASGNWHDNPTFSAIHTQATRISAVGFGLGGATGGMDDRFDFIMMSENCRGQGTFYYKEDSYLAYGNNGNCFDKSVHDSSCTGIYSLALREKLHNMSDHLPVIMQFKTPLSFNIPTSIKSNEGKSAQSIELINGNLIDDYLNIKLNIPSSISEKIIVYNILGQVLITKKIKANSQKVKVDVRGLKPGMYFLQFENRKASAIKFIKK